MSKRSSRSMRTWRKFHRYTFGYSKWVSLISVVLIIVISVTGILLIHQNVLTVRFKDEAFIIPANSVGRNVDMEGLFIVEKISNPLGSHQACAEGGEHSGEGACESERAEKTVHKVADMRYTLVSTGLVLS